MFEKLKEFKRKVVNFILALAFFAVAPYGIFSALFSED